MGMVCLLGFRAEWVKEGKLLVPCRCWGRKTRTPEPETRVGVTLSDPRSPRGHDRLPTPIPRG